MFKKVRTFHPNALIADTHFRTYVESFESELLRGISTVVIIQIIKELSDEGIYGYQLLKILQERTNNMLIIDEGTLYPLLKKMAKDGILRMERRESGGRSRNYYIITEEGNKLLNHMTGFFSKLLEAISPIMDVEIKLPEDRFMYCPNCSNKIKLDALTKFCEICGFYVEEMINQR